MNNSQNMKRKLISKRLVDISSLVAELRKKNPLRMKRYYESKVDAGYDIGWSACIDELERLLKEKEFKELEHDIERC